MAERSLTPDELADFSAGYLIDAFTAKPHDVVLPFVVPAAAAAHVVAIVRKRMEQAVAGGVAMTWEIEEAVPVGGGNVIICISARPAP